MEWTDYIFKWISANNAVIINVLLALSAVMASIFAGLTFWQAKKFRIRDELNNRAIINQTTPSGYLRYYKDNDEDKICLSINFENVGNNPASEIKMHILYLNQIMLRENKKLPKTFNTSYFPSFNPVPTKGTIGISIIKRKLSDIGLTEEKIENTNYVIVKVFYKDQLLQKQFSNIFYWYVDTNGSFIEIFEKDYQKLKILSVIMD